MKQHWQEQLHARIADAIRGARDGHSAQWLADRTAQLGFPITRAAIANYESGRKKGLDVAELLVIAAALGVPPIALLFAALPDGPVEVLPGVIVPSSAAAEWFSGEEHLVLPRMPDLEPSSKLAVLVRAVLSRRDKRKNLEQLAALSLAINGVSAPESETVVRAREEIARLETQIRALGGVIDSA